MTGMQIAASTAIMAMTLNNSMSVKPFLRDIVQRYDGDRIVIAGVMKGQVNVGECNGINRHLCQRIFDGLAVVKAHRHRVGCMDCFVNAGMFFAVYCENDFGNA